MSGEEMIIDITDDGMTVEAKGFKGKACTESLDKLITDMAKDGIKGTITDQTKKAEYNVVRSDTRVHQRRD
jgi:hypothetical protein